MKQSNGFRDNHPGSTRRQSTEENKKNRLFMAGTFETRKKIAKGPNKNENNPENKENNDELTHPKPKLGHHVENI